MGETSKRLFALSRIPQEDYDTPVDPGDGSPQTFEQIVKEGYEFANLTTTTADNAGFSTGTPNPTISELDKHDADFALRERMTAERLGRRLTAAMGLPVTTAVVGSTGAYKHVFVPLNPHLEADLPVYTYVEKDGEPEDSGDTTDDRMLPSAGLENLELSSDAQNAYLMGASNWRTSGKVIDSSGVDFTEDNTGHVLLDDYAGEHSIKSGQALVEIYPQINFGGTAIEVLCDFRGVRIGYNPNRDPNAGYLGCGKFQNQSDPNSGNVRGSFPAGNPTTSLYFTLIKSIAFAQGFDPLAKMRAQTQFSIDFTYTGVLMSGITGTPINYKAIFRYKKLTVESVVQGDENGKGTYEITTKPLSLGQSYPLEVQLFNKIASYAALS